MPKDVRDALEFVAQQEGKMSPEEASLWVDKLELAKRFQSETWS
jgi:sulfite reductase alpha subunit-like flavoprotein